MKPPAEQLEVIVKRATKRGWDASGVNWSEFYAGESKSIAEFVILTKGVSALLFNTNFAKALFGEEVRDFEPDWNKLPNYKYHLQQAVLLESDEERINYFYEHSKGDR